MMFAGACACRRCAEYRILASWLEVLKLSHFLRTKKLISHQLDRFLRLGLLPLKDIKHKYLKHVGNKIEL